MGTRGLVRIIWKAKCYYIYNQFDSYPEFLGELVVMLIKTQGVLKWGERLENAKIDEDTLEGVLYDKMTIYSVIMKQHIPSFVKESISEMEMEEKINYNSIEWVYTIDLDNNIFVVQWDERSFIKFELDKIPYNWRSEINL